MLPTATGKPLHCLIFPLLGKLLKIASIPALMHIDQQFHSVIVGGKSFFIKIILFGNRDQTNLSNIATATSTRNISILKGMSSCSFLCAHVKDIARAYFV